MHQSPNLALPYIAPSQAQKHVTHNEAIRALDAVVQISVATRSSNEPPLAPSEGDRFIVGDQPADSWANDTGKIAAWQDGAWAFYPPQVGWLAWIIDEQQLCVYDGVHWRLCAQAGSGTSGGTAIFGINTSADTTNRLAVSSPAILLDHEGGDMRAAINRASDSNTASVVFQTNYVGHAEFGLAGAAGFQLKVSPDGQNWNEAMIVDHNTGAITFPNSTFAGAGTGNGGQSMGRSLIINGNFQLNSRGFSGGQLAAGTYGFDRWKGGSEGATVSRSGSVVTLSAGSLIQVVEPAAFGMENLTDRDLTLSLENPSADVLVKIGTKSGTIAAGTGRKSVSVSLSSSEAAMVSTELSAASGGSVSFERVRLDVGQNAIDWQPVAISQETDLANRYYRRGYIAADFNGNANEVLTVSVQFPTSMRTTPNVALETAVADSNLKLGFPAFHQLSTSSSAAAIQLVAQNVGRTYWYGFYTADAEL